jgi:hypothetical protein
MHKDYLRRRATVAEWEAEHLIEGVAFGHCNREWEALKAKMGPGDEMWFWSSDEESWKQMMGWEGMALVRRGEVIDFFLTALN